MKKIYCEKCGYKIFNSNKEYCPRCGSRVHSYSEVKSMQKNETIKTLIIILLVIIFILCLIWSYGLLVNNNAVVIG